MNLEQTLTLLVREFEEEKRELERNHSSQLEQGLAELTNLRQRCQLQEKELAHIKKLARRILDQRSELEVFFLQALEHVKKEITLHR